MDLTLIFITHNSENVIGRCLDACGGEDFRYLLVDNASSDGTLAAARAALPSVELLALPENLGYGGAANRGLEAVTTPYALLLNPDVLASPEDIHRLLALHRAHEPLVMSSCLIQTPDAKGEMQMDYVTPIDPALTVNWVPRVVGAVMLFTMERLKKVGFFDPNIFMYYEDDELCLRSRNLGERMAIFPAVVFTHLAGQSSPQTLPYRKLKAWHLIWAKLYYRRLDKGKGKALRLNLAFLLRFAFKYVNALLRGQPEEATVVACQWKAALAYLLGKPAYYRREEP